MDRKLTLRLKRGVYDVLLTAQIMFRALQKLNLSQFYAVGGGRALDRIVSMAENPQPLLCVQPIAGTLLTETGRDATSVDD
jgi:hypothetical protein